MSNPVMTTKGLIDIEELVITHPTETIENCIKVATEYRHNGELVRRDVAASMLRGPESNAISGKLS
jgi:hypothetical protein